MKKTHIHIFLHTYFSVVPTVEIKKRYPTSLIKIFNITHFHTVYSIPDHFIIGQLLALDNDSFVLQKNEWIHLHTRERNELSST